MISKAKGNRKGKKKVKNSPKCTLKEHVKKCDVIAELANAQSGLAFGKVVRGDADLVKKEVNRLFARRAEQKKALAGHAHIRERHLSLINIHVYSTESQALFDTGAVPNIMSPQLINWLLLMPGGTSKHKTVDNWKIQSVWE